MSRVSRRTSRILGAGVTLAALIGTSSLVPAAAAPTTPNNLGKLSDYVKTVQAKGGHVLSGRYFVQVSGAPTVDGGSAAAATSSQDAVRRAAGVQGLKVRVNRSYTKLWNGFSATLSDADARAMQAVPGVAAVFPVVQVERPTDPKASTNDTSSDAMGGVSAVKSELGYTGKGIKVGVIDTGIDLDNPDFGGTGVNGTTPFPNKKVIAGYDFVGDNYDADTGSPAVPDPNPDDTCAGHGSHVSGIIAADGDPAKNGVQGVAPKALLGEYRVFGCEGSTSTDIILQALERAYSDGMNVVNMSLGDAFMTWPDYPDAVASDKLVKHGVTVVASAGNSGESGAMSTGAPSVGSRVISVASIENNVITAPAFQVTPDGSLIGYGNAEGSPILGTTGSHKLVAAGAPGTAASLGCDPIAPVAPDTVLLISRGTCTFYAKAMNAQQAGAAGVVLYNNTTGTLSPTVVGDPPITIPVVMITQADGQKLQTLLAASSPITLTATDKTVKSANPNGGLISSFSSWGLAADLSLKPDIAAPGGSIWSSYPLELGGHASLSGTSMAAPYVTGCVALLMQARPELKSKPATIQKLLMNTANMDNLWSFAPALGLPEMVTRQGAGLIQIDQAILANQSLNTAKINLGEGEKGAKKVKLTVTNSARRAITYKVATTDSIGYVGNSDPAFDLLSASVKAPATVTVPAHGSKSFTVTVGQPADAPNGYVYGGWIQLTAGGATTLTVPFAGMAGDYQQVPIFDDSVDGDLYPALGVYSAAAKAAVPAPANQPTYTMAGNDVPYLLFHLEYPVSDLLVDVYKVTNGKRVFVGHYFQLGEYGRDDSHLSLPWDGTVTVGSGKKAKTVTVGAGSYLLEMRGLPPMANPKKASNWVIWDTPAFTIADPAKAKTASTANAGALSESGTNS